MGTLLQVTPGSGDCSCGVARGNWLDTGRTRHPGRGRSRPPPAPPPQTPSTQPLSLPPPPEGLCLPVGLGDSCAKRWLRRSPGTERGLRDPHSLSTGFVLSLQQETRFPSWKCCALPVPFPVPRCCPTSHGCYSLTTSPCWQPPAAPHPRTGCVGGTGMDPTPDHVPSAISQPSAPSSSHRAFRVCSLS